ncbi:MAG: shikimate kinase [Lachnospiraceae bacterium]|nr:shikimate kinase [Lachnospiraceae bacterium]
MTENIVLIGMPGAGKSTVGVVLAKRLGYRFVDSDLVIQERYGKLLHQLIEENGVEGFWKMENEVNASLDLKQSVIATGGSAVYEEEAMKHLGDIGTIVYLELPYKEIAERLGDLNARGVTLRPGQTLKDLYEERKPLYEKYAQLTIQCEGKMLWKIVAEIDARIR